MIRTSSIVLPVACAFLLAACPSPDDAPVPSPANSGDPIVDQYVKAYAGNQLNGIQMDAEVSATLPKLQKEGKLRALRTITKVGKITWDRLNFTGDNTIKKDVIARYIQTEMEGQDTTKIGINAANYKFKSKGVDTRNGREVYIYQVQPRKKRVGLFKGEIWIDKESYLPVREAGEFVKNPSVFLKKVQFVRDYEIREGKAFPKHVESLVETRLWGPAQMTIDFNNFAPEAPLSAEAPPPPAATEVAKW